MNFSLGADDRFLTFAPRWADLPPVWYFLLLAALVLGPLGLIFWLSRLERRLVAPWQAWGLLSLRLGLVVVLWFTVAFRPALLHTEVEETTGRVRVAVDLSGSMETCDLQRTLAEKIRLARALRLPWPGPALDEALVERWLRHLETDESASLPGRAALEEWTAGVDRLTRQQIAERILAPEGVDLLGRLAQRHRVEIVGFDQQERKADLASWRELFAPHRALAASATNLRVPLEETPERGEDPLLGIVLLSDGRHNVGPAPLARAEALGKQRLPIYPIALGARQPPAELRIVDLQAPAKVFKGLKIEVKARVQVTHLPAQDLTVEMQVEGKPVEAEHRTIIKHKGTDRSYPIEFPLTLNDAGAQTITMRVRPQGEKDTPTAKGDKSRIILVGDEPARVLLVDGEARWEYRYLAAVLGRDPQIRLERVLYVQPRIGMIKEDQLEKSGLPGRRLPDVPATGGEPLFEYDCILLGDVAPEQLGPEERRRLDAYVARRGGTLVLSAGKRYLPLAYEANPGAAQDALVKMLPIQAARVVQPPNGFTLRLSPAGRRTVFLHLQPEEPAEPWPRLPKHFWGIIGQRKPGASVLAVPDSSALSFGDDPREGIIVQQSYGAGRVVFVGLDSTWRWRAESGDLHHHRFWGQLVLWAAADKLLPGGNRYVRYGTREASYPEGKEVEVIVRLADDLPPPATTGEARVQLVRQREDGDKLEAVVPLSVSAGNDRVLEGRVRGLPPGAYSIRLALPAYRDKLPEPAAEKTPLFRVLPEENEEMADVSTNWDLLHALAQASNGRFYRADEAGQIAERLAWRIQRRELREESRPWQDEPLVWWLLGGLLTLLTLEWSWRKWLDLP
jgi:hypothetical protein